MTAPTPPNPILAAASYRVEYTREGSVFDRVHTTVDAYSEADAEARVRHSLAFYTGVEILRVARLGTSETVDCTYIGPPGNDGPWDFLNHHDHRAPVIVCDVHGAPAHECVYDSDTDLVGRYAGPCQRFPAPPPPGWA